MHVRTYYAVPTAYTVGEEFLTFTAAVAFAQSTIQPLGLAAYNDGVERYSRAFVDERHVVRGPDGTTDTVRVRWEVHRDGSTTLLRDGVAA